MAAAAATKLFVMLVPTRGATLDEVKAVRLDLLLKMVAGNSGVPEEHVQLGQPFCLNEFSFRGLQLREAEMPFVLCPLYGPGVTDGMRNKFLSTDPSIAVGESAPGVGKRAAVRIVEMKDVVRP